MTTIDTATTMLRLPETDVVIDESQLGGDRVSGALQRANVGCLPPRPARLLPVGCGQRARGAGGDPAAHRALPQLDGGARSRGVDYRPAAVDGVRLLRKPHPDCRGEQLKQARRRRVRQMRRWPVATTKPLMGTGSVIETRSKSARRRSVSSSTAVGSRLLLAVTRSMTSRCRLCA